jgi:hypothetical protein
MPGPGSIRTKEYDAAKEAVCAEHPEAEAVFDAIEWELEHAEGLTRHPAVGESPVRHVSVPRGAMTPGIVVVFAVELFGVDRKITLLDARISADADDWDESE